MTERGNKGSKLLGIYVSPEIAREFKIRATIEGRSMTKIVEELIRDYLKKKKG